MKNQRHETIFYKYLNISTSSLAQPWDPSLYIVFVVELQNNIT